MAAEQRNGAIPAEVVDLSDEELIREIDEEARKRLRISFKQFVEEYRAGTLPDTLAPCRSLAHSGVT